MKNFLAFALSALIIFVAAFGVTEYLSGTVKIIEGENPDIWYFKTYDGAARTDLPEFSDENGEKEQALIEIIRNAERKHIKTSAKAASGDDLDYEIGVIDGEGSFVLRFGKECHVFYEKTEYEITNGAEIIKEIDKIIG